MQYSLHTKSTSVNTATAALGGSDQVRETLVYLYFLWDGACRIFYIVTERLCLMPVAHKHWFAQAHHALALLGLEFSAFEKSDNSRGIWCISKNNEVTEVQRFGASQKGSELEPAPKLKCPVCEHLVNWIWTLSVFRVWTEFTRFMAHTAAALESLQQMN